MTALQELELEYIDRYGDMAAYLIRDLMEFYGDEAQAEAEERLLEIWSTRQETELVFIGGRGWIKPAQTTWDALIEITPEYQSELEAHEARRAKEMEDKPWFNYKRF